MIAVFHNTSLCHCSRCERWNRGFRRIERFLIGGVIAFVIFLVIHVIRWAATGFPGLLRIGGM